MVWSDFIVFEDVMKGERKIEWVDAYLTRFSEAMTLVETALPRACNSIVSWVSRYFFPRNT